MLFQGTTASEYQRHEPFTEPSHHNEIFSLGDTCVHGDQNTARTDYFRGEGILPLDHHQPSTSVVPYWQENPGLMISHGTNVVSENHKSLHHFSEHIIILPHFTVGQG